MSWRESRNSWRNLCRIAVVLAAASLTGGCFEPLYGTRPAAGTENVHDKLAMIDVPAIVAPKGQPAARIGVNLHNALQYDLNGGAGAKAPLYRLNVGVSTSQLTIIVDITSGRPNAQVDSVNASFSLVEIATGKTVLSDSTFSHVDFDAPGSEQRFAEQRAQRDAEDRATQAVAEAIRIRLASYFIAGT